MNHEQLEALTKFKHFMAKEFRKLEPECPREVLDDCNKCPFFQWCNLCCRMRKLSKDITDNIVEAK